MGTFTLDTPILLANGYQMTFNVAAGTCNGAITVDSSKISITCTDDSMDGGTATTVNRTLTITTASVSASTVTCDLSEYVFNDSTVVKVTLQAAAFTDVTPDTSEALAETSVDIVTTPSTLDYGLPRACWISPAHQRFAGSTVTMDAQAGCLYGVERIKGILRYRTAVVTDGSGITGTFTYNEAVSWTGGTGVFAPGSTHQTGAGAAKTIHVFVRTGVAPSAALTITGGTSGATCVVASVSGGTEYTSTQTSRTLRTPTTSYGPSSQYEVWRFTWTGIAATGAYEREMTIYPHVGDTALVSTSAATRWFATGDNEVYVDHASAESFSTKYVDSRYVASCGGAGALSGNITGGLFKVYPAGVETTTPLEFIGFYNAGTLTAVKVNVQTQTSGATSLYYCDMPNQLAVYTMTISSLAGAGGNPAYGDMIHESGTLPGISTIEMGMVLKYNSGTSELTYLRLTTSANFDNGDSLVLRDRNGDDRNITFTAGAPSAAITTAAAASGYTFEAYGSGVTGTLDGAAPATVGNDTTGTGAEGAPYFSLTKAINSIGTGATLVDGSTIRCFPGLYSGDNSATGTKSSTKHHWLHVRPHASYAAKDIFFVNSLDTTRGLRVNFARWTGTVWSCKVSSEGVFFTDGSPESAASPGTVDNRPALWLDGCLGVGVNRFSASVCSYKINESGGGNYRLAYVTDSRFAFMSFQASHVIDSRCDYLGYVHPHSGNHASINTRCNDLKEFSYGSGYHLDFHLVSTSLDPMNIVITNSMATGFVNSQGIFGGTSTNGTYGGLYFENIMVPDDGTSAASQYVASATSTAVRWADITIVQSTLADTLDLRAQFSGSAGVLYIDRVQARGCLLYSYNRQTDSGATANCPLGATSVNNHISALGNAGAGATTLDDAATNTSNSAFSVVCVSESEASSDWLRPKAGSVLLDRVESTPSDWPNYPKYDIDGRLMSDDATALAAIGARQPLPVLTVTYDGASVSDGGTVTEGAGSKDLVMSAATGPTGSVVYISDVAFGGTVTGTDASPYTLTSGGSTQSATIGTTLTAGAGTVDITYDLGSVFDFDITGQSAGGGFRARSRSRKR